MSDHQLINTLLQGDKKALRLFYNSFTPRLKNFIAYKVADPADAEEILQDTLLDSLEALRDFTGESTLFTYLCAIAKHKIVDFYRKKRIKKIVFSRIPAIEQLFTLATIPEEELNERITQKKVQEILSQLRPSYCQVLKLRYLKGFSVKQVAKNMAVSFKSAESLLFRAKKAFVLAYYERRPNISQITGQT